MATKKEIKEVLKILNLTENDMDDFWNELIETNWKIKSLNNSGKTWKDMNTFVISQLPTQKQKDIESADRKKKEDEEKIQSELKIKQEKEYYNSHFDEIMLKKIDNHENLTEDEIKKLVWNYEDESYREEGDNGRWSQSITSYIQLKNRHFYIAWNRGLTEYQENGFYKQPIEVELHTYEKVIPEHKETVTEWVNK